ncbi:TetR/AcrR family transcriptional regulator [Sulfurimonas sp.]|uniref:TetR/AcrR family transcriptional regulator n=1 Tax=Sulfurimonas sp. TaxID=2022749 RepID=UPI0026294ACF|nr:TetR/AcrR family transcriptional regulator [Sulfurimonas sp.]
MIKHDYHHGNLKEEFITIAMDFIAKEDVEKLTLKVLSDATGTSRSAIYKHFKNKDALIETIIERGFDKFDVETTPNLKDNSKALVDKFYLTGKLYVEFARKNPNLYRLLFGKKYAHIREEILSIKDEDCSGFAALQKTVEDGQKQGVLKKEESYKQAIVIWATMHGISSLIIDGFMDVENVYEDMYDTLFETLLTGLMANKVKIISTVPVLKKLLQPKN